MRITVFRRDSSLRNRLTEIGIVFQMRTNDSVRTFFSKLKDSSARYLWLLRHKMVAALRLWIIGCTLELIIIIIIIMPSLLITGCILHCFIVTVITFIIKTIIIILPWSNLERMLWSRDSYVWADLCRQRCSSLGSALDDDEYARLYFDTSVGCSKYAMPVIVSFYSTITITFRVFMAMSSGVVLWPTDWSRRQRCSLVRQWNAHDFISRSIHSIRVGK